MAVTCTNCGTRNPEGNAFCGRCGLALPSSDAATLPALPEQPVAPPPAGPVVPPTPQAAQATPPQAPIYQAPSPAGTSAPPPSPPAAATRIPVALIIGSVLGLVAVLILAAVAVYAVALPHPAPTPKPFPTAPPTAPPTVAPTAVPTAVASPTPAPTAAPPTVTPGATSYSVQFVSVTAASPWYLYQKNGCCYIFLDNRDRPDADFYVNSGYARGGTTSIPKLEQSALSTDMGASFQGTHVCAQRSGVTVNGITGTLVNICTTFTPSNGNPAYSAFDLWFLATGAGGTKVYEIELFDSTSDFKSFETATLPLRQSIVWRLR